MRPRKEHDACQKRLRRARASSRFSTDAVASAAQFAVEAVAAERFCMANDDDLIARSRDGHVHSPEVAQKSYVALLVGTHHGDDDHIALLPLKGIHGVDAHLPAEGLQEIIALEELPQQPHLRLVGGYDGKVNALRSDAARSQLLYILNSATL